MGSITLPLSLELMTVTTESLFETFNRSEVLGYCQGCNNYGKNYSCPDFTFDEEATLKSYPYVTLILTRASTEDLSDQWSLYAGKQFDSQVSDLHGSSKATTAVAMQAFNCIKDLMSEALLDAEKVIHDSLSSPPGSCTRCAPCYKSKGEPCMHPDELRYSLEAYGFLVSDIYKDFFDLTLEWSEECLPKAYHSCSALFSQKPIEASELKTRLNKKVKVLTLNYVG